MSRLRVVGMVLAGGVALVVGGLGAGYLYAGHAAATVKDKHWETHDVDFPVPWPLTPEEIEAIRAERLAAMPPIELVDGAAPIEPPDPMAGVDLDAIARERAAARGKHYAESIYTCQVCHGPTLAGGAMLNEPMVGVLKAPNITRGGATAAYTPRDWDRAVRHGVLPDGMSSLMPVSDFRNLSDHELSDIIAYVDTLPPATGGETSFEWGPIGKLLIATGQLVPEVEGVKDHYAGHAAEPPPIAPTAAYGGHIVTVCMGCHGQQLAGGTIPFGPPDWPPASNLTLHSDGLASWTFEDFDRALRTGVTKDGSTLAMPMAEMLAFTPNFTDTEVRAIWAYIESIPPLPTGP